MCNSFNRWFASYLEEKESEVSKLMEDKTALEFLITWSIFESDCFNGEFYSNKIADYSTKVVSKPSFKRERFTEILRYFHNRYQDLGLYKNLMHKWKLGRMRMDQILKKDVNDLTPSEEIFFVVGVVYRYRNNIFHGNKGVESWLRFQKQINFCREIMQNLINISETAQKGRP